MNSLFIKCSWANFLVNFSPMSFPVFQLSNNDDNGVNNSVVIDDDDNGNVANNSDSDGDNDGNDKAIDII